MKFTVKLFALVLAGLLALSLCADAAPFGNILQEDLPCFLLRLAIPRISIALCRLHTHVSFFLVKSVFSIMRRKKKKYTRGNYSKRSLQSTKKVI